MIGGKFHLNYTPNKLVAYARYRSGGKCVVLKNSAGNHFVFDKQFFDNNFRLVEWKEAW